MASHNLANLDFRGGLKSVVLFRKIPQENSMSIKHPWPCKINVWNRLPTFFSTSLGNLLILQKKFIQKYPFQSGGGPWKCMKNSRVPPPSSYILRGGGWSADVRVWRCRSADMRVWRCRSADVRVWRCRSADVRVWRCRSADVKVWRCRSADVRVWRSRSAGVRVWRCRSANVRVWRCITTAGF